MIFILNAFGQYFCCCCDDDDDDDWYVLYDVMITTGKGDFKVEDEVCKDEC